MKRNKIDEISFMGGLRRIKYDKHCISLTVINSYCACGCWDSVNKKSSRH